MAEISGLALTTAAVGGVFIYGAITGKSPLAAAQAAIRGTNPKSLPQTTGLAGGSAVSGGGSSGSGGNKFFGGVPQVSSGAIESQFFDFALHTMHFTKAGAAGAAGNIQRESGWDPTNDTGDGGTSGGLCQWHLGRFDGLKNYAAHHGLDWQSPEAQFGWMRVELHSGYADVLAVCLSASSPESAAAYWASRYEGCTDCHAGTAEMAARQAAARQYFNQL